jgi:hypothetical protein
MNKNEMPIETWNRMNPKEFWEIYGDPILQLKETAVLLNYGRDTLESHRRNCPDCREYNRTHDAAVNHLYESLYYQMCVKRSFEAKNK